MRIVILASDSRGFGSYCLPALAASPAIEVASVIECEGVVTKPWRRRWRKLKKTVDIGVLGALNGRRMRRWYALAEELQIEPLEDAAGRAGARFARTPSLLDQRTVDLCREANADLGLSLGNGYIPSRVFAVPRYGMINVHHELLPEFQGAQSVIWQLHEGVANTGFTIHQIDKRIDTGAILYRRELDITFGATLAETVQRTYADLWRSSREALVEVVSDFETRLASARQQGPGRNFTTPTWSQFRRIVRNHEILRRQAAESPPR